MRALLFTMSIVVLAACDSPKAEPAAPSPPPDDACRELAGLCHAPDKQDGGALVHECHHLGHAHDEAACATRREECRKACSPPP